MGKNNTQIATWRDLNSIGYRTFYTEKDSDRCVTYSDLSKLSRGYDDGYATAYAQLDNNSKRAFVTNNAEIEINHKDSFNKIPIVLLGNITETTSTSINQLISPGAAFGPEQTLGWFSFPNVGELAEVQFTFPEIPLYISVNKPSNMNGKVAVWLELNYGESWYDSEHLETLQSTTIDLSLVADEYACAITFPQSINLDTFGVNDTNLNFFILVKWQFIALTWSNLVSARLISTTFTCGVVNSGVSLYYPKQCVPWTVIKASQGQLTSVSKPVTVPVRSRIAEGLTGSTYVNYIRFYYYYLPEGSNTWKEIQTGGGYLSDGSINTSAQTVFQVIINPKVTETVAQDCLLIRCGEAGSSRRYSYKQEINGNLDSQWTSLSNSKRVALILGQNTGKVYNTILSQLTGIEFYVGK